MDFISRKFLIVASVFILFLSGCNSTPPTSTRDTKTVSAKRIALNEAFEARGFYLSSLNNINYLNAKQCGDYQLQSHRGSIRHPENSVNAVIDAIDNGLTLSKSMYGSPLMACGLFITINKQVEKRERLIISEEKSNESATKKSGATFVLVIRIRDNY